MDNLIYNRQQELSLYYPERVAIIGCGGVGTWVGIFLAMSGVKKIILFDSDILEIHNLNRLPYTREDVGKLKVNLLKESIIRIRPECEVMAFSFEFSQRCWDIMEFPSIIFCCTDTFKTQVEIYQQCRKRCIPFIRVGYDGTHVTITDHIPTWNTGEGNNENENGYQIVPSWVIPSAIAGSLAVFKAMYNAELKILKDIEKF